MLGLFGVCVGAAILELIVPGEARGTTKVMLRLLVVLTVLVLILTPLFSFLRGNELEGIADAFLQEGELEEYYEGIFEDTLARGGEAELSALIAERLAREYGLEASDFRVLAVLDDASGECRVSVYLSGKAILLDPRRVEEMLTQLLSCEVEVR